MTSEWRGRLILISICVWFVAFGVYWFWPETIVRHDPGVLVKDEPIQKPTTAPGWEKEGYHFTPLAEFDAKVLILHLKKYRTGRESDLSPIDLAVGWGPMSDQSVIDRLEISQSGRWYEYKARLLPLPQKLIAVSSSNMHMIPANDEVDDALGDLHRGDVISFSGYLVEVRADDGWHWRSSTTRTDEGNGACEVVWVKRLSKIE
jgi:hypothetical protein